MRNEKISHVKIGSNRMVDFPWHFVGDVEDVSALVIFVAFAEIFQ